MNRNTVIDYSNDLIGHVVLFYKGYYKGKTLDEVVQAYAGLSSDYKVSTRDEMNYLLEILFQCTENPQGQSRDIVSSILFHSARKLKKMTSYGIEREDNLPVQSVIQGLAENVRLLTIKDMFGNDLVRLPATLPEERFKS